MATYLPDTNVLIDALNGKRGRKEFLRRLVWEGHQLACCAITVAEVYSGMQPHEAKATDQFLSTLDWYDIPRSLTERAGRLRFEWLRKGVTLAMLDILIAATAVEYNLTLITDDRKHFPMPELKLYVENSSSA